MWACLRRTHVSELLKQPGRGERTWRPPTSKIRRTSACNLPLNGRSLMGSEKREPNVEGFALGLARIFSWKTTSSSFNVGPKYLVSSWWSSGLISKESSFLFEEATKDTKGASSTGRGATGPSAVTEEVVSLLEAVINAFSDGVGVGSGSSSGFNPVDEASPLGSVVLLVASARGLRFCSSTTCYYVLAEEIYIAKR